jgi:hypothetical protein
MAPDMQLMDSNANADEALKGSKFWSEFINELSIDIPTWKDLDTITVYGFQNDREFQNSKF